MRTSRGPVWMLLPLVSLLCVPRGQAQPQQTPKTSEDSRSKGKGFLLAEPQPSQVSERASDSVSTAFGVPRLIRFSGTLKDHLGNPLSGTAGVSFALYKDPEGGVPVWLEKQNVKLDKQGRYTVLLGATKSEGLPLELFSAGEPRWLGVQVNLPGEVEQPRVLLVSVPYALKAADADTLGGKPLSSFVLTNPSSQGGAVISALPNSTGAASIGGGGSPDVVTKFDPTGANVVNSSITDNGSRITVGEGIDFSSDFSFVGNAEPARTGRVQMFDRANVGFVLRGLNLLVETLQGSSFVPTEVMRWTQAGKVGIGTSSPAAKLEVAGNVKISGAGSGMILPDSTVRTSASSINGTLSVAGPIQITGAGNGIVVKNPFGTQCKQIGIDNTGSVGATLVPCLTPRFAYVANTFDSTVSIYAVDATSGLLRPNGYVFLGATYYGPQSVVVDPSNKFVYVADSHSQTISGFTINAGSGTLTPTSPALFAVGGAFVVTVDPSGKFVYVATGTGVEAFTINAATGALSPVYGSPFAAGINPQWVTVDPSGKFVYATDNTVTSTGTGYIYGYTINSSTGALTPVTGSPFSTGNSPDGVTVDPSGRFVYVANRWANSVSAFTINAASGALTPVPGSPYPAGSTPEWVVVDPSGRFVYVGDSAGNSLGQSSVYVFAINPTSGALAPVPGNSPFLSTASVYGLTMDPSGKFLYGPGGISVFSVDSSTGAMNLLPQTPIATRAQSSAIAFSTGPPAVFIPQFAYVANANSNNVSAFTINPTSGALTPVAGSPFAAGLAPTSVTVDLSGKFAYVANSGDNSVSAFTINPTSGALSPVAGSPFAAGTTPQSVTVEPSGRFAYVANANSFGFGNVSGFAIDPTSGALAPLSGSPFYGYPTATNPYWVTVDPSGRFAYVANSGSNNVTAFQINASIGNLGSASGSEFAAGTNPRSVTVDPTGKFAYVANRGSNNVSAFSIGATSGGALAGVPGSPFATATAPNSVTVDPSGRFAYVANVNSNNVSAFAINSTSGALTPVAGSPFAAGSFPISVTVDPSGKFAYVANFGSRNVSVFSIDPTAGALAPVPGSPFAAGTAPISVFVTGKIQ